MDYSLLGSSVPGVLQARILEWVTISFPRGSSQPRGQTQVSCVTGGFFSTWATREAPKLLRSGPKSSAAAAAAAAAKSLQSCPTLCNPMDGSPPGSPVPGILQARTLEWVAISFSHAWKWKGKVKSLSRALLFSDPMDCSLPGSSAHGIFQARETYFQLMTFYETALII